MEMSSIWDHQRPNCIILDEIDGAMNGSEGRSGIGVIMTMITAPLRADKKATRHHPLIRPIICICNDAFAPVLRPLRNVALHFKMNPPRQPRIVQRLKVCSRIVWRRRHTVLMRWSGHMRSREHFNDFHGAIQAL